MYLIVGVYFVSSGKLLRKLNINPKSLSNVTEQ